MKTLAGVLCIFLFLACRPAPQPIEYGSDLCDYCKMTIVDRQHAAEAVTGKGRAYRFDAIECLLNYIEPTSDTDWAFLLVADYEQPGVLIDAQESHYLISPNLPSPMGAFLSAFAEESAAQETQAAKDGRLYDWSSVREELRRNGVIKQVSAQ
ncbi:MAG: nitrous oxide reductase accessory protein NosL [Saprospiraceae bacterium]|nr:nitrous oxide reductase accessory protein NosL [Saprospiraceae bacterium]